MSISDESPERPREVDVTIGNEPKTWHAERIGDLASDEVIVRADTAAVRDLPAVKAMLGKGEELIVLWARLTDPDTNQLLKEGQEVVAWMRVKKNGMIVRRTALFSLGAVAAIVIGKQAINHRKPR